MVTCKCMPPLHHCQQPLSSPGLVQLCLALLPLCCSDVQGMLRVDPPCTQRPENPIGMTAAIETPRLLSFE